ncbi:MAG TPA: ABC transporter substrate-binding protein [Anaerolineales bacterium]|nr:ABC transporter substrate-binding protein [Anaerolineales bacterium]
MNKRTLTGIILFCLLVSLAGCTKIEAPELTLITVQLSWFHQAEFAGFYAAEQQGYFAEEGLQVSFLEGGPEVDFIAPVVNSTAQFGVAQPADLILARAAGKPVRSIAVIYRRSPIVFFSHADLGITRPQDFVGKKIRSAITLDQTLRATMARAGIRPDQYEVVYLPGDVSLFASREVPIWVGFINIIALDVQRDGYKINIIYPDDYGIHFYGDVLITTDDLIAQDPDLVQRFTRAALKGWTFAVENPDTIGKFVQKYNTDADEALENERMIASLPLVNTGEDFIGWMKLEVWSGMEQTLREQNVLTIPLEVEQVYTMQFLETIYGK